MRMRQPCRHQQIDTTRPELWEDLAMRTGPQLHSLAQPLEYDLNHLTGYRVEGNPDLAKANLSLRIVGTGNTRDRCHRQHQHH